MAITELMSGKQLGFGDYEQSTTKEQTKREKFLAEKEKVVPCQPLIDRPALSTGNHAPDSLDAALVLTE